MFHFKLNCFLYDHLLWNFHCSLFKFWEKWFPHTINQYTTKNSPLTVSVTIWLRRSVWGPMRLQNKLHAVEIKGITCSACYIPAYVERQQTKVRIWRETDWIQIRVLPLPSCGIRWGYLTSLCLSFLTCKIVANSRTIS